MWHFELSFTNHLRAIKLLLSSVLRAADKMKFLIENSFDKSDQIHNFLSIWSDLLKKPLLEN